MCGAIITAELVVFAVNEGVLKVVSRCKESEIYLQTFRVPESRTGSTLSLKDVYVARVALIFQSIE